MNFQVRKLETSSAPALASIGYDATFDPLQTRRAAEVWTRHNGLDARWFAGLPVMPAVSRSMLLQQAIKSAFDRVVALLALFALLPLFVLVAIAIKVASPGPILFRQLREGKDGVLFSAFKFRSMRAELGDATGVAQTTEADPRMSPIGPLLRRTSIDELPQLLNVLRGEMSIVGPRPHVPGMRAAGRRYDELVPYYSRRTAMLPGITGWAQCNGLRGSTTDARRAIARIEYDMAYIQNFSLGLDIKIILLTLKNEFLSGSGH